MKIHPAEHELLAMRRSYLFSGLTDEDYAAIAAHTGLLTLTTGQMLFGQGEKVTAIYWVGEGMIKLTRVSPQGDEKVIELISPGRFFAEAMLFMSGSGYPVNAIAQGPTRIIAIDSEPLYNWLSHDVSRCFRVLSGMSLRLHKLINDIERLTLMKGTDRLLQYLVDHSEPDAEGRTMVEFEAPKQVIASRIGVKPETLSRLLHKLSDQGCIRLEGGKLYIIDLEQMRQVHAD